MENKPDASQPDWIWCLVGNVIDEHAFGKDRETVRGTKQFRPGAKVYCLPVQWGDGYERIVVVGKPRKSHGLIRVVMRREYIENFRCQKVFSPAVIRCMYRNDEVRPWSGSDEDRRRILSMIKWLNLTEDETRRRRILMYLSSFVLESKILSEEGPSVVFRIERRDRRDDYDGCAWYGFVAYDSESERPLGVLDWCGYWPEARDDSCPNGFRDRTDLVDGLCDAGLHTWDACYSKPSNDGGPLYSWKLSVEDSRGNSFTSEGCNACPDGLPQLYHYLEAWGFPRVWNMEDRAPSTHIR